jgi:nucleotidyltransferase/DNA polymerase involved in DNA repair
MERVIVVRCPRLLSEGDRGEEVRAFARVLEGVEQSCPWVEPIRLGVCSLPARGPSRFFGGEGPVMTRLRTTVGEILGSDVGVGVADGLFAAVLASRSQLAVPRGRTAAFLAPWSVAVLRRQELAVTLQRLGLPTLGQFAALPTRHVLARFGTDVSACHRVARAEEGELVGLRDPGILRRLQVARGEAAEGSEQPGFFGGSSAVDERAARSFHRVQRRLGSEAVLVGRLRGGRAPAERASLSPWGSREHGPGDEGPGPWPGRLPVPSPVAVLSEPVTAEVTDSAARPVLVTGRGLLSAPPVRLSVAGGPWRALVAWAGPWPVTDRWWSGRRRRAHLQVVTEDGTAALLAVERGSWWLEGVYD